MIIPHLFENRYIGWLIKFKQSKSPALKLGAKYCKLGGQVRQIVYFGRRNISVLLLAGIIAETGTCKQQKKAVNPTRKN
jgi:hypothetical protein